MTISKPGGFIDDTLAHRRRILGDDHPDTLTTASDARPRFCGTWVTISRPGSSQSDAFTRSRRVLGEDHPATLNSAGMLSQRPVVVG